MFIPLESFIVRVTSIEPFPVIDADLFVVFLSTPESDHNVFPPDVISILTVFTTFSVDVLFVEFVALVLSVYPPVIDFTSMLTDIVLLASKLFTVIVIAEPLSTIFPESKLCFNTTPVSFELSSAFVIVTVNPASSSSFLASSCFLPTI